VTGSELANALFAQGQADEAEVIRRELVRLQPDDPEVSGRLYELLVNRGKTDEARAILNRWIDRFRREPDNPVAHLNMGLIYRKLHDLPHEIAELKEAARLGAHHPDFSHELGHRLLIANDLKGAIEAFREAIRVFPEDINCHYELAFARCLSADHPGEIAALREAIRLESTVKYPHSPRPPVELRIVYPPFLWDENAYFIWNESFDDYEQGHVALGTALAENGDLERAIAEYRVALRLGETEEYRHYQYFGQNSTVGNNEPSYPHRCLGMALLSAGDFLNAIAELRDAIRIQPYLAAQDVGFQLCFALGRAGDTAGAVAVVRLAIEQSESHRLEPLPLLGTIAFANRAAETVTTFRRIRAQAGDDKAVVGWIDSAISLTERIAALGPRLPRITHRVGGSSSYYADWCSRRQFFAASAGLWSAALEVDSSLSEGPDRNCRFRAACAAAMAGCGQGKDDPPPDETAKTKLRRQAMEWLKADLTALSKLLEGGKPDDPSRCMQMLRTWKDEPGLAGVRDEANLRKFSDEERTEWQTLWRDVEALLIRADGKTP
jgi:tetratricopeptide (TPR) repeat protein